MNCLRSPLNVPSRTVEELRCADAGLLLCREAARVNGLGDQSGRHAQIESMLAHPLAGPLLLGRVEDFVDEHLARFAVLHRENVARDLDQIAFELRLVPGVEDVVQLVVGEADRVLEQK